MRSAQTMQDTTESIDAPTLKKILKATRENPKEVYSPSDDSFLMLEAISSFPLKEKEVLDLGTGSGVLGLYAALQGAIVTISDIDEVAVKCATKAAQSLGVKCNKVVSDLFMKIAGKFDVILFNPPYLPSQSTVDRTIDGGRDGVIVADRFLCGLDEHLKADGVAFLLLSSLNNPAALLDGHREFTYSVVKKCPLFFEELQVLELRFRDLGD